MHFSLQNFEHLIRTHRQRSIRDQARRYELMPYLLQAVSATRVRLEYREEFRKGKKLRYWALEYEIDRFISLKLVLRQVGSGAKHFHSLFPYTRAAR